MAILNEKELLEERIAQVEASIAAKNRKNEDISKEMEQLNSLTESLKKLNKASS